MKAREFPCAAGEWLVFSAGLYWRGIRINKPIHSVDVLPGLYIVPFAGSLCYVAAQVQYMNIHPGVRWICWHRYRWWLWLPKLHAVSDMRKTPNVEVTGKPPRGAAGAR